VYALRIHVIRLIQVPEAFPEIQDGTLIFRIENHLLRSPYAIA